MIKKQCYTSHDLTAALSLTLSPTPPAPCGFLPWPFPSLKSVGALSLQKSPRVQRCMRRRLFDFLPWQRSWGGWISKQKEKILTLVPNAKQAFFSFFFWSSILFSLLFLFLIFCVFTFALPVSNRGWKYLKLFRKHVLLIFLTGTGTECMTYELLPLWCSVTEAGSAKHECIRLTLALRGLPRSRSHWWGFQKMNNQADSSSVH